MYISVKCIWTIHFLCINVLLMSNVSQICEVIGRSVLAGRLGVGRQAVSNAVADGQFPACWYIIVKKECEQRRLDCPRELFRFKAYPQELKTHLFEPSEKVA